MKKQHLGNAQVCLLQRVLWQIRCPAYRPRMRQKRTICPNCNSLRSRDQPRLNEDLLVQIPDTLWRPAWGHRTQDLAVGRLACGRGLLHQKGLMPSVPLLNQTDGQQLIVIGMIVLFHSEQEAL